jgi:hypothetical protein
VQCGQELRDRGEREKMSCRIKYGVRCTHLEGDDGRSTVERSIRPDLISKDHPAE